MTVSGESQSQTIDMGASMETEEGLAIIDALSIEASNSKVGAR